MPTIITNETGRRLRAEAREANRPPRTGPMNLGPKDEPLTIARGRLESILVALGPASQLEGGAVPPAAWAARRAREAEAIRRVLRGEA